MTMDKVHEVFKVMLDFPDYYGDNYNALYDELTSVHENIEIEVMVKKRDLARWEILRRVLLDAKNDNRYIALKEIKYNR